MNLASVCLKSYVNKKVTFDDLVTKVLAVFYTGLEGVCRTHYTSSRNPLTPFV